MKKRICFLSILIVAALVFGCQKTPESGEIVSQNAIENSLSTTKSEKSKLNCEESIVWADTKDINGVELSVQIDATREAITQKLPVVTIEPISFSLSFFEEIRDYFAVGECYNAQDSKDDVLKRKIFFEQHIDKNKIKDQEAVLINERSWLEKLYNEAPNENASPVVPNNDPFDKILVKSYPSPEEIAYISIINDGIVMTGSNYYVKGYGESKFLLAEIISEDETESVNNLEYNSALEKAQKLVEYIFPENMKFRAGYNATEEYVYEFLFKDGSDKQKKIFAFFYAPTYNGVPSLLVDPATIVGTGEDNDEFAPEYLKESIAVVANENEVLGFFYTSPSKIMDIKNDNVGILPFDEILKRFQSNIFVHYIWGIPGSSVKIRVEKIKFGMERLPVKDNANQYLMVPAWNFVGSVENYFSEEVGELYEENKSIFVINAIDGSIISQSQVLQLF